jgi:CRP-like cAMP-binding protein
MLEIVRNLRFFSDVPEEDLRQIASMARLESHGNNIVLFREGTVLNHIYVVVDGSVGVELQGVTREGRRILTVGTGELLGWSPILHQAPMTATARTLAPTRLLSINADQMMGLCERDPHFGFTFMRRTAEALAARLNATRLQLLDVFKDDLPVVMDEPGGGD